jgi:chromate transporter
MSSELQVIQSGAAAVEVAAKRPALEYRFVVGPTDSIITRINALRKWRRRLDRHRNEKTIGDASILKKPDNRVTAFRIFTEFLRLGTTAFGGPAMVVYIRDLAVHKNRWVSEQSFADGAALCQSIPGATSMQTAAYTGLRAGGPIGALAAFTGFGLPAFLLMVALSAAYQASHNLQPVISAFHGLHGIVIAIVANATLNFGKSTLTNWRDAILATGSATYLILHGSPIISIFVAAILALLFYHGLDLKSKPSHPYDIQAGRQSLKFAAILSLALIIGLTALFLLNRQLFSLAALMMRIDLFAFGGGFASVPLMLHEVVDVRHWLGSKAFMDGIALGQVTPGPIVITATFVGFAIAGLSGAIVGTIGVFAPSFLIVLIATPYLDRLQSSRFFRRTLRGALASFVGLLGAVTVNFSTAISWTFPMGFIVVGAFVALRLKVDILWVVIAGAAVSIFIL